MAENNNPNVNINLNNGSTDESDYSLKQFQRNNYFYGKLLTVEDFNTEQRYLNEKRYLINKNILGTGVCCGLDVISIKKQDQILQATISRGLAIDCCGREIIVGGPQQMDCDILNSDNLDFTKKIGLYIRRKDIDRYPVPSPANTSSCEEACCYGRVEENFELLFDYVSQQDNLLPLMIFDKSRYDVNDNVTIKLIDPSFTVNPAPSPAPSNTRTIRVSSLQNTGGMSITLHLISNTNAFKGSFSLEPDPHPSENSLAVNPDGDIITVVYSDGQRTFTFYASVVSNDIDKKDFNKHKIADDYYKENLEDCPQCEGIQQNSSNMGVLLAVIKQDAPTNSLSIDIENTVRYRKIIYGNPMLYDLLSQHLLDKNNPHEIKALKSINGVGNIDDLPPVTNIDLLSNTETIDFNPSPNVSGGISVDLADNSVSTQKLQDLSVSTPKIANDSVTTQKLNVNWIGNGGISIQENKDPNKNTITISSSNISKNLQITSGVIERIKIDPGKYTILGPIGHKIPITDDRPSFPAIILGQIRSIGESNSLLMDMESLSSVVSYLFRTEVQPLTQQDAQTANDLGLTNFLFKKEDPVYYKAINITKTSFNVLLIRSFPILINNQFLFNGLQCGLLI